jgi:hypothetical protein
MSPFDIFARLAQLVERGTFNTVVAIPAALIPDRSGSDDVKFFWPQTAGN